VTDLLPEEWYSTRNLRFLTINDFKRYCRKEGIQILQNLFSPEKIYTKLKPNLFSEYAIFVLKK
ncbi:MAG: methionine biosynthesis protein MetW, partial [Candidatus Aminicenantes bacterium]|nr:methionine biosynthesis protein MetW [Candidatus Aminicenantes bacterium]